LSIDERAWPIVSGELKLEGRLHEGAGSLAAVVMHPHSLYGGDMDNHVVVAVCEALASMGATTLRFNFRGVGESQGAYDDGRGEADDARAAIACIRRQALSAKLLIVGYSFGAMIAAAVAGESNPAGVVLISPPAGMPTPDALSSVARALLVTGDRDPVSPAAAVMALASGTVTVKIVRGADHGWWPGIDDLAAEVATFSRLV
jgi:alpha/beta superfamily hydrolase